MSDEKPKWDMSKVRLDYYLLGRPTEYNVWDPNQLLNTVRKVMSREIRRR